MKKLVLFFLVIGQFVFAGPKNKEPAFPEIRITISEAQFKGLSGSRGSKLDLKDVVMLINGDTARVKEIHSRGNNSLNYERKSLAVDLSSSISIHQDGKKIKLRHFDLLNLVMDHHLWHNRWAFLTMADLGVFPLYNTYCKLWINGKHHGIYLLVEKPSGYARDAGSPFTIRRGYENKIDKEYTHTDSKEEIKKYRNQFHDMYRVIQHANAEAVYSGLASKIDLQKYFTWLVFNFLVMNGDYADELFMYIHPDTKLYTVIPWDYDDIIRPAPHEGWEKRNATVKYKLIFSSEESLDVTIANNEAVYQQYVVRFKEILLQMNEETITRYAHKVRDELRVLAADPEVGSSTLFLGKDPFDINKAEESITTAIDFLISRRNGILSQLKD